MSFLRMYADALRDTVRAVGKSPWTLLLPMAYLVGVGLLIPFIAQLGIAGGFIFALLRTALLASLLYIVSEMVGGSKVAGQEVPNSFEPYFWSVLNVFFMLWIGSLILGPMIAQHPKAAAIQLGLTAILGVLLNAVPEMIYQRGEYGLLAPLMASIQFVQDHWLEWLPPNLLLLAWWFYGRDLLFSRLPMGFLVDGVVTGALFLFGMVFRGFLFRELTTSNPRQRELRARLGR